MTQQLILELPDNLYNAVKWTAESNAKTPSEWVLAQLPQLLPARVFDGVGNGNYHNDEHDNGQALLDGEDVGFSAEEQALIKKEKEAMEASWQAYLAEVEEMRRRPPMTKEESAAHVREALFRMGGGHTLSDEEVLELAMSEEIAEENLEMDLC
jgi:hypothetical protein